MCFEHIMDCHGLDRGFKIKILLPVVKDKLSQSSHVTCLKSQSYTYWEPDDGVTVYKKFVWVGEVSCKVQILIRNIGLNQLMVNVTENIQHSEHGNSGLVASTY